MRVTVLPVVLVLLVVLAQQVLAVVVAVRRADHGVDVLGFGRDLRRPGSATGVWWSNSMRMTGLWMR